MSSVQGGLGGKVEINDGTFSSVTSWNFKQLKWNQSSWRFIYLEFCCYSTVNIFLSHRMLVSQAFFVESAFFHYTAVNIDHKSTMNWVLWSLLWDKPAPPITLKPYIARLLQINVRDILDVKCAGWAVWEGRNQWWNYLFCNLVKF